MKTCKEIAEMWNVTERTVTTFCKSGRIPGAVKNGKSWQIPDDARKPVDGRVSSGKYPVIFLTFKDVKFDLWEATIDKIRDLLQEEYFSVGFYLVLIIHQSNQSEHQSMIKALCSGISGEGRYDISLIPGEKRYPGIIMELKWKKGLDEEALEQLSGEALDQIDDKGYDFEMREDGVENISKFGIAFCGKKVVIQTTDEIDSDTFVIIEPRH